MKVRLFFSWCTSVWNDAIIAYTDVKEKDDIIYGTGKDRIQAFWLDVDG
jgi:hypothetical protein